MYARHAMKLLNVANPIQEHSGIKLNAAVLQIKAACEVYSLQNASVL
jgi:hypothetical protein